MISFSGMDGSGKSFQIRRLENYFDSRNVSYKTIWARGSWTPGIEIIKNIVRTDRGLSEKQKIEYRKKARFDPKIQKIILVLSILDLLWFFGIYYRLMGLFGKTVICDRYIWDTVVDFRVDFHNIDFEKWIIWKLLMTIIPVPYPSFILVIDSKESFERGMRKKEAYMDSLKTKQMKVKVYDKLIRQGRFSNILDGYSTADCISDQIRGVLLNEN